MQSDFLNVDEYMTSVPLERLEPLNKIRNLCTKYLNNHSETMFYRMPTYLKNEVSEVAFNSQKNYISLYVVPAVLDKYRDKLKDCGKGCIRFKDANKIDFALIQAIIRDVAGL